MSPEELNVVLAEVDSRVRTSIQENERRGNFDRRDVNGMIGHVNKSIYRMLQKDATKELVLRECIDAMVYLVGIYAIRRELYGERGFHAKPLSDQG